MRTSLLTAVLVAALAACHSKPQDTSPPDRGSDGGSGTGVEVGSGGGAGGDGSGTAAQAAGPGMGEPCAADDVCGAGLSCVKYYGIAGPSGPEFKSCEHQCKGDADCGDGHHCAMIADGPGHVCR